MQNKPVKHRDPLVHIVKREGLPGWGAWLIRLTAIVLGLLTCGIVAMLLTGKSFGDVYTAMFEGAFGRILYGNTTTLWRILERTAI